MPRPKRAAHYITKEISLPAALALQVDAELFSELEGKVPFAAWQKLLVQLLGEWLLRQEQARKQHQASEQQP